MCCFQSLRPCSHPNLSRKYWQSARGLPVTTAIPKGKRLLSSCNTPCEYDQRTTQKQHRCVRRRTEGHCRQHTRREDTACKRVRSMRARIGRRPMAAQKSEDTGCTAKPTQHGDDKHSAVLTARLTSYPTTVPDDQGASMCMRPLQRQAMHTFPVPHQGADTSPITFRLLSGNTFGWN